VYFTINLLTYLIELCDSNDAVHTTHGSADSCLAGAVLGGGNRGRDTPPQSDGYPRYLPNEMSMRKICSNYKSPTVRVAGNFSTSAKV